ncbi:hypothetical protein ACFLXI_04820 [Chloroflexota bacterium]
MISSRIMFLLAKFILVTSMLACGLFSWKNESNDTTSNTDQSTYSVSPDESITQQALEDQTSPDNIPERTESTPVADPDLRDEYRSPEGGYAFKPIPDYEFEEFFGLTTMIAPDANSDLGPVFMLIGGISHEDVTSDEIFTEFLLDAESEDVEILNQKEITVDGKSGLIADITGDVNGQPLTGKIVVISVTPSQQFSMFASAPRDRWEEIGSSFEEVLASVYFFEPQEFNFDIEFEETQPAEESPDDSP